MIHRHVPIWFPDLDRMFHREKCFFRQPATQEATVDGVTLEMATAFHLLAAPRPDTIDGDASGKQPVIEDLVAGKIRNGRDIERNEIGMMAFGENGRGFERLPAAGAVLAARPRLAGGRLLPPKPFRPATHCWRSPDLSTIDCGAAFAVPLVVV